MSAALAVSKVLPILLLILLGHVMRRTKYLSPSVMAGMKKLAVNVTLPLVIFTSLLDLDFKRTYLLLALFVFLLCILLLAAGRVLVRLCGARGPYSANLFTSFENGMMGYAVFAAVFGQQRLYPIVILDLGQTLFFSLLFVPYMQILEGKRSALTLGVLLLTFLKNPFVWASALAMGLGSCGAAAFIHQTFALEAVLESFRLLSGLTTPVMCLAIGYEICVEPQRILKPLAVVGARLALLLCAAWLFNGLVIDRLLHLEPIFKTAVTTMCMLPPFFVGALLIGEEAAGERQFAFNVISVHILVFLALFPLAASILPGAP